MTETTKAYKETKKVIKTVKGSIGDFYENETKQGVPIGNYTLYESADVIEDDSSLSFNDNKYKLVFYGENRCNAAKTKLAKGMAIEATGAYREREYEDKEKNKNISYEIKVEGIKIINKGENKND